MAKAIINKHINNINELNDDLFVSNNEHSKGEIIICNDKNNPSIYIKNTEGAITKIVGESIGGDSYDDTELRQQITANTNDIKELKEKGVSVNIAESEEDKTESKEEINKNFLEYEDEENGSKSLAVRSIDTDATILQKDITVAGIKGTLGSGKYKNGDVIQKGTSMYEIIQNILCQELYPENVFEERANASVSLNDLILVLNYDNNEIVEVGTLVKLIEGKTNGVEINTIPSKIEGIKWGYSLENDNIIDFKETIILKECTVSIMDNMHKISAIIDNGFDADKIKYIKTTPENKEGDGLVELDETNLGCVIEGDNKISIHATGGTYNYYADKINKIYYISNLGKTNENEFNNGIPETTGIINPPTKIANSTVIGKYYYFFGFSEKNDYRDFTSDDIRGLIKSDWIIKDGITTIVGEDKITSNGKSIVIACPSKYKLNTVDNSIGANILPNFSSVGNVSVKTGEIMTDYNVYVYPITNNAIVELKNVTLS